MERINRPAAGSPKHGHGIGIAGVDQLDQCLRDWYPSVRALSPVIGILVLWMAIRHRVIRPNGSGQPPQCFLADNSLPN